MCVWRGEGTLCFTLCVCLKKKKKNSECLKFSFFSSPFIYIYIACHDDHTAQHRKLLSTIRGSSIKSADKLRLALLYVLRYEDNANIPALKQELIDGGVNEEKVKLIDLILLKAGKAKRAPGLYGDGNFMSRMSKNLSTSLAGVENVREKQRETKDRT